MMKIATPSSTSASASLLQRHRLISLPSKYLNFFSFSSSAISNNTFPGLPRPSTFNSILTTHGIPSSALLPFHSSPYPPLPSPTGHTKLSPITAPPSVLRTLHPLARPLLHHVESDTYICALESPTTLPSSPPKDPSSHLTLSPIVLARPGKGCTGIHIVAANSEHLLRRAALVSDFEKHTTSSSLIELYNSTLKEMTSFNPTLANPYTAGETSKLAKFGIDKVTLLLVGPFPDLYRRLALENAIVHKHEINALSSSESANGKFAGYGSLIASYSEVLGMFGEVRGGECRDAARTVIKGKGIWTVGVEEEALIGVSRRANVGLSTLSDDEIISKYGEFYEEVLRSEHETKEGKNERDSLLDEAQVVMDREFLKGRQCDWSGEVRGVLSGIYEKAGLKNLADLVR